MLYILHIISAFVNYRKTNLSIYYKTHYLCINLACLFVCLHSINVKTAEPIGTKFFVGHHVTTRKVYE